MCFCVERYMNYYGLTVKIGLTSFFTIRIESTLSTMAASSSLGFSCRKRCSQSNKEIVSSKTHLKLLKFSAYHKELHGRQCLAIWFLHWLRKDRLSFDWTSYIHFFFFFIVCDLYIQILCIFFPLNLAVWASFLQGQKQSKELRRSPKEKTFKTICL